MTVVHKKAGRADTFSPSVSTDLQTDTIAAIATACGMGGIGIVRLSGPSAHAVACALFHPGAAQNDAAADHDPPLLMPYRLNYGYIVDPGNGRAVDEVLLAFMPGPHSYTREDVVEIQSHGGAVVLSRLLTLVLRNGVRLAEPGEFTRRAFLNGRIDLTQAEAVADLICATSESALQLAADQLRGGLKTRIEHLLNTINEICADLEALIEFPEDLDADPDHGCSRTVLMSELIEPIEQMLLRYDGGRMLRDGVQVAIAGRPNVGKSSLLNQLLREEKAIVTSVPGTTRDPVEGRNTFKGVSFWFSDTAGIHPSQDPVEAIGMRKSKEAIGAADIVLMLIDASAPTWPGDIDAFRAAQHRPMVLVVNKIDLVDRVDGIALPDCYRNLPAHFVSALKGTGIDTLMETIFSLTIKDSSPASPSKEAMIVDVRHKACLEEALFNLRRALTGFEAGAPEDLVCLDLQHARRALERITGGHADQDILDIIFARFCIGK